MKFADEFIPFFLSFCSTSILITLALYFKTIYNITKNKYRTKTKVNNYVSSANIDFSDSKESIKRTVETKSNMFINTIIRKKYEKKKSVLRTKASNPEFMQKIISYSKRPYLTKTDKQLKID